MSSSLLRAAMFGAAAVAVGVAAVGCGGNSQPSGCGLLIPSPPELNYPLPGATGVPDAPGELIVSPNLLSGTYSLIGGGATVALGAPSTALPNPLPTPNDAPSEPPNEPLYVFPIGTLRASTTYRVYFDSQSPSVCGVSTTGTIGSFTTE